jgi:hypothetical protein
MNSNPSIQDLNDPGQFELIAAVDQHRIKDFVLQQIMTDKKIVPVYMVYQTLFFLTAIFFLTRAIILGYRGNWMYLLVTALSIIFCFTLLVVIHESLHAIALKLSGAPKVTISGFWRKFIFFAEADQFVLGKNAFLFVALTPLVLVQIVTVIGIIIWFHQPLLYFFLMVMTIHSFFCSGDMALVTLFYRFPGRKIFTYDNHSEKRSYYFVQRIEKLEVG